MKIGVLIFATDYTIQMDELARELEDRGFESLFIPEHTHIPASQESAWPGVLTSLKSTPTPTTHSSDCLSLQR